MEKYLSLPVDVILEAVEPEGAVVCSKRPLPHYDWHSDRFEGGYGGRVLAGVGLEVRRARGNVPGLVDVGIYREVRAPQGKSAPGLHAEAERVLVRNIRWYIRIVQMRSFLV